MRYSTRLAFLFSLLAAPGFAGTEFATAATVVQVAGLSHVIALKSDGTVTGWGRNNYGQLGDTTGVPIRDHHYPVRPVAIPLPGKALSIGVGGSTSYAVMEDGTLLAWGGGRRGELGNGAAGMSSRLANGNAGSARPVTVAGLADVVQVAGSASTTMALLRDGSVHVWGSGEQGTLGNGIPVEYGRPPAPAPSPVRVQGLPQITQISAGSAHMLALTADGRVFAWGSNNAAELGRGTRSERGVSIPAEVQDLSGVVAIAAGKEVSSVLKSDGTVWVWGSNLHGQHGNGVLEGSIGPHGGFAARPVQVPGIAGVIAIGSDHGAGRHTMALLKDGTLRAWGNTDWGQIGAGVSGTFQLRPQTPKITGVKAFFVGGGRSFAVRNDGSFWIWGQRAYGDGALEKHLRVPTPFALN